MAQPASTSAATSAPRSSRSANPKLLRTISASTISPTRAPRLQKMHLRSSSQLFARLCPVPGRKIVGPSRSAWGGSLCSSSSAMAPQN